jgi:hypothetical protein
MDPRLSIGRAKITGAGANLRGGVEMKESVAQPRRESPACHPPLPGVENASPCNNIRVDLCAAALPYC